MIIQDAYRFNTETTMIGENNSIIKDDEINDLSLGKITTKSNDNKSNRIVKKKKTKREKLIN